MASSGHLNRMWEQSSESTCVSCGERHMLPVLFGCLHTSFSSSFFLFFLPHQYSHSALLPLEFFDAMTQISLWVLSRKESRAWKKGAGTEGDEGTKGTRLPPEAADELSLVLLCNIFSCVASFEFYCYKFTSYILWSWIPRHVPVKTRSSEHQLSLQVQLQSQLMLVFIQVTKGAPKTVMG